MPLSRSHLSPGAATVSYQPPGGERRKLITVPEPSACPCVQLQLHRQMAVHAWLLYHLLIIAAATPPPHEQGPGRRAQAEANLGFRQSHADKPEFILL